MKKIKPCPFCGRKPKGIYKNPHGDLAWIACERDGCLYDVDTGCQTSWEDAIKLWNTRNRGTRK